MSTNAHIGIYKDGKIEYIYSHWDGYPQHVGRILQEHYTDVEKIQELIALGDISNLGQKVKPDENQEHSFDNPLRDVTVAYHRDRGESYDDVKAALTDNINDFKNNIEYAYIFNIDPEKADTLPLNKWTFYVYGQSKYDLETECQKFQ